jgi:uncharacterized protein
MSLQLEIDQQAIGDFSEGIIIRRLALFGSAVRDCFDVPSDVDMLVEFDPTQVAGLIRSGAWSGNSVSFSAGDGRIW